MIIRRFKPVDMFSVIKLASETLTEIYNPNLFNYFYEVFPRGFIVAENNHKLVGFIVGLPLDSTSAKILMLSVSKNSRRQGIGSMLLKEFIKEVTPLGVVNVELEVRTDNLAAISFYRVHGFDVVDTIPRFYRNEEDAYVMVKKVR